MKKEKPRKEMSLSDYAELLPPQNVNSYIGVMGNGEIDPNSRPILDFNVKGEIPKSYMDKVPPFLTNKEGKRNAQAYDFIIDQFNVENQARYKRDKYTYCNTFVWDVMTAMGFNWDNMGATDMHIQLEKESEKSDSGWIEVSAREAQEYADMGMLSISAWRRKGDEGDSHVQIVRPMRKGDAFDPEMGPFVAQAGASNFSYDYAIRALGKNKLFGLSGNDPTRFFVYLK